MQLDPDMGKEEMLLFRHLFLLLRLPLLFSAAAGVFAADVGTAVILAADAIIVVYSTEAAALVVVSAETVALVEFVASPNMLLL